MSQFKDIIDEGEDDDNDLYDFSNTQLANDYDDEDDILPSQIDTENKNWGGEGVERGDDMGIGGGEVEGKFFESETGGKEAPRPMTSIQSKGYDPSAEKKNLKTSNVPGTRVIKPLKKRSDNSPEYRALEMEREVNKLYEKSSLEIKNKNALLAIERAKEALKLEIKLSKFQEEVNITDNNIDLTFAVNYNLAHIYYLNGMFVESLEAFKKIVRNKAFVQLGGGRMRVNIGNIHFDQGQYQEAIKNYTIAIDQITPAHHKDLRSHIYKNIGICYFKLQKYNDATVNFEQAFETKASIQAVYDLILCYYALGDKKNMKKCFVKLLSLKIPGMLVDDLDVDEEKTIQNDELGEYLREKRRLYYDYILKSARLIASHIESTWERGYDFVIEKLRTFQLRNENCELSNEMEMEKALKYLRNKQFSKAIEALKAFEKRGKKLQAIAATNLSFIYILERNLKMAFKYSTLAMDCDKYNAKALVNHGICLFLEKKYGQAKDFFSRALNIQSDCVEAIYNIGLVDKIQLRYKEALRTFSRLFSFIPDSIDVIYHIADIYDKLEDTDNSQDWYNRLITRAPSDPQALFELGKLYEKENDDANSYNCFMESYKYYPVNLEVVKKLGFYFVQNDIYEKALKYFERASQIRPKEVEWKLYVGSCLRRVGQYSKAYNCYKKIHKNFPENIECIKYLIQICGELGNETEKVFYTERLQQLEKKLEKRRRTTKKVNPSSSSSMKLEEEVEKEEDDILNQQKQIEKQKEVERFKEIGKNPKPKKKKVEDDYLPRPDDKDEYKDVNDRTIENDASDDLIDIDGLDIIEQLYT